MAAFDKIKSGIPGMDDILDYIRLGDNVVWQVSGIEEFKFFTLPFVNQAKLDGRSITYVRFAQHPPILEDLDGVDKDMVEAEMTYSAIWNDSRTLRYAPDLLADEPDLFPEICPDQAELQGLIAVREPRDLHFWLDSVKNHALCGIGEQSGEEM